MVFQAVPICLPVQGYVPPPLLRSDWVDIHFGEDSLMIADARGGVDPVELVWHI